MKKGFENVPPLPLNNSGAGLGSTPQKSSNGTAQRMYTNLAEGSPQRSQFFQDERQVNRRKHQRLEALVEELKIAEERGMPAGSKLLVDARGLRIGDEGCKYLCEKLEDSTVASAVDLRCNGLTSLSARSLAHCFETNTSVKSFDFSCNPMIGDETVRIMAESLVQSTNGSLPALPPTLNARPLQLRAHPCVISKLQLQYCMVGANGAFHLAEALQRNNTLTSLNLRDNNIGDDGLAAIAVALKTNNTVTELDVEMNKIGNQGAVELADALRRNTGLLFLDLSINFIGNTGAAALSDALEQSNNTVQTINLLGNMVEDS